jgi:putative transcriptional regulator
MKKTNKKYKSDAFEAIHSAVSGMYTAGTVSKATMRHFDETCLSTLEELSPKQIKELRESYHVSQPVFARYLNTSESTVEKWESGATRPQGAALKLLAVAKKHGLEVLV